MTSSIHPYTNYGDRYPKLGSGITANCYDMGGGVVRKALVIPQPKIILNEVECLRRLNELSETNFPRLYDYSATELWIDMSYCGKTLHHTKVPADWKQQHDHIHNILSSAKIYHDDMSFGNILIDDKGHINLIDYSQAHLDSLEIDTTKRLYIFLHDAYIEQHKNRTFIHKIHKERDSR